MTIMYAAALLIVSLAFFWAFGFAFLTSISRGRDIEESIFIAPLIGIGIVLAVTGNLLRLDVKMLIILYVILGIFIVLSVISITRLKKTKIIFSINKTEWILFLLAMLIVSLVQGWSYFVLGPGQFIGFGTRDMWNYTAVAQSFMDIPFSTTLVSGNQNPLLPIFEYLKNGRMGPSVIQAVIASAWAHNAKEVWGIISLMGPILLICPLWLIAKEMRLTLPYRFLAVLMGGSLPGTEWIHLENTFLSHALSLPFLLLWPYVIYRLLKEPSIYFIVITATLFFSFAYIYGDMLLLLIVLAMIVTLWDIVMSHSFTHSLQKLGAVIMAIVLGACFIPAYTQTLLQFFQLPFRNVTAWPSFGLTVTGLARAWTMNTAVLENNDFSHAVILFTVLSILLCFFGMLLFFFRKRTTLSFALLLLVCVPLALASYPIPQTYQYYKVVVSIAPVLPIGLLYLCQWFRVDGTRESIVIKAGLLVSVGFLLVLAMYSTSCASLPLVAKNNFYRDPQLTQWMNKFEKMRNENILVVSDNGAVGTWLAYHGRKNHLWFARDFYGSWAGDNAAKYQQYLDLNALPNDYQIVQLMPAFTTHVLGLAQRLAIIAQTDGNGEGGSGPLTVAIDKPLRLKILSKDDRIITLSFDVPAHQKMRIGNDEIGYTTFGNVQKVNYPMRLKKGINFITIYFIKVPGRDTSAMQLTNTAYF